LRAFDGGDVQILLAAILNDLFLVVNKRSRGGDAMLVLDFRRVVSMIEAPELGRRFTRPYFTRSRRVAESMLSHSHFVSAWRCQKRVPSKNMFGSTRESRLSSSLPALVF